MACIYAEGLSPYENKGKCGLPEKFDVKEDIEYKVKMFAKWIRESKHVVFHTGAGISTTAGIPDFRGPNGVWTLEAKGVKPKMSVGFDEAVPTVTHMAMVALEREGLVKFIVSQNIDGLHLKSGIGRDKLAELHGNMFVGQCNRCSRQFVLPKCVTSVGQKCLNLPCPKVKTNGRKCRGKLYDTVLDWECNLPYGDLSMSEAHSSVADLSVCLGTTLQIVPSGTLPLYTKKNGGKLVICNLQPTKHDKKADLIINTYVDTMMEMLMKELDIAIPKYDPAGDTIKLLGTKLSYLEWTISEDVMKSKPITPNKRKSTPNDSVPKRQKTEEKTNLEIKQEVKCEYSQEGSEMYVDSVELASEQSLTCEQDSKNCCNDITTTSHCGNTISPLAIPVCHSKILGSPEIKLEASSTCKYPSQMDSTSCEPLHNAIDRSMHKIAPQTLMENPIDKVAVTEGKIACQSSCTKFKEEVMDARTVPYEVQSHFDDARFVMNNLLKELEECC